ncbi:MAG TPA: DNA alkylation repair protein [Spirochaetota bacterium]|nr:DNA alkylation repair protein [Spirochaetota bacterium]HPV42590.1 DNA alkylation repair protein [Spirochaetota bacterium]
MSLKELRAELRALADPRQAEVLMRFFKTGPGQYGEGDRFLGIKVPAQRAVAKKHSGIPLGDVKKLLDSPIHEERLVSLMILIEKYNRADDAGRKEIVDLYLANTHNINNWDLVDLSAPQLLGRHLHGGSMKPLKKLARSSSLWERRIALLSTHYFIKRGDYDMTLELAELLLEDDHDLIHKAAGWMLREVGKRDMEIEKGFLDKHAAAMPRTMLRYAIERFPEKMRRSYMAK